MLAPSIEIVDAHLDYNGHLLFDRLSLSVAGGLFTCLLGPSGVGKSSLLRLIAGLKTFAISNPIKASDHHPLKGRIAYLAQDEKLLPWLTVAKNVMIGQLLRGQPITQKDEAHAQSLLRRVGLERHAASFPKQLSGGMRQRVLLARTAFEDKPVILMDEPFASLDVITKTRIQELTSELFRGRTVLLVTHDPLEALRLGHRIYVMSGLPAAITTQITLPGDPPHNLMDRELHALQAEILDKLSHAKGVLEC